MFAASEHGTCSRLTNSNLYSFVIKSKQCTICGRRFRTPAVLRMHKRLCHATEEIAGNETVESVDNATSATVVTPSEAVQNGQYLCSSVCSSFSNLPVSGGSHPPTK